MKAARKNEELSYLVGWDGHGAPHELLGLVTLLRKFKATEPRDKIYRLSEFAADLGSDWSEVNYKSLLKSVYGTYTQWFVNH